MKKKVNVFGKSIPVLAIFVLGIALVSAALVGYLSGTITGLVTANSPMEQSIGLDLNNLVVDGVLNFETIHGGGEITFYAKTENLADKPITGDVMNLVTSAPVEDIEVSCNDFTLSATTTSTYQSLEDVPQGVINTCNYKSDWVYECGPYPPTCTKLSNNELRIHYGPADILTWTSGQVDVTEITATFALNSVGTYTFTSEVLNP